MGTQRVYNFAAGPSQLPLEVLERAQKEMLNYHSSGMSVMEMSHRSSIFHSIYVHTDEAFRKVMNVPDNYDVLYLTGGGSTQFAMVPMNLIGRTKKADYALTGNFSEKAYEEAKRYGNVRVAFSDKENGYHHIPRQGEIVVDPDASYFHYCANNTIYGTKYHQLPETGKVPLVADISSCIMSEPIDVSKFALLYAGAQKNLAPAGLTVVIVREDLIGHAMDITPTMFNYQIHADNGSMFNTPPCYTIYIAGKVMKWVKKTFGTLEALKAHNEKKAAILYNFLDQSKLFKGTVVPEDRSLMNVPFVTGNTDLDAEFVAAAKKAGFVNIKGHRTVGGMRASIYNAMPMEGVEKLVAFMAEFEKEHQ